jgi:hypothetical protein
VRFGREADAEIARNHRIFEGIVLLSQPTQTSQPRPRRPRSAWESGAWRPDSTYTRSGRGGRFDDCAALLPLTCLRTEPVHPPGTESMVPQ